MASSRKSGVSAVVWGAAHLDESLRFVDVGATQTLRVPRRDLASVAAALDPSDVDLGAVIGPNRELTQQTV